MIDDIYVSTDSLTTITEKKLDNYSFGVYPNPFNSFTSVFLSSEFNTNESWKIELYDVYGKEVKHITVPNGEKKVILNRDNLSVGIYFAKISIENKIITKKIIITK